MFNCYANHLLIMFYALFFCSLSVVAQDSAQIIKKYQDTALHRINGQVTQLLTQEKKQYPDTSLFTNAYHGLKSNLNDKMSGVKRIPQSIKKPVLKSQIPNPKNSLPILPHFSRPVFLANAGRVDYNFYYRSNVDTPFVERNVYQHQVNSALQLTVGNAIPVLINTQIRRSNSLLFHDITAIQVQFDVQSFQQNIYKNALTGLGNQAASLKDSATGLLSDLKFVELNQASLSFNSRFTVQQYVEANEVLNVPELSWDKTLSDSLARKKSDSTRAAAQAFLREYNQSKDAVEKIKYKADSLKNVYNKSIGEAKKITDFTKSRINNYDQFQELKNNSAVKEKGLTVLPDKYNWLLGIRKFSLGRSPLNYSELTAKNISLNGINFEYNSWYYFALCAGLVDFRFRDFVINRNAHPRQYFYMARIGLGNVDKSHIVFSVFKGRKQVFASGSINAPYTFNATGATLEAKYQLTRNIYVKGEIAESLSPDFRTNPAKYNSWNLNDKNDKAYAVSSHIRLPKTNTTIDGAYKYSGANYQSFSSYQTNSSLVAWSVKADQYLFKRTIKIMAAVRKDDFSNPYLLRDYHSNTVFKSFQVYFRKRHWPIISGGYMPLSQLTNISGVLYENRFNSLNGTISHFYKLGERKAGTTIMYTKFYNASADSGFIYFNSQNIFFNQVIDLVWYTATINLTHSTNKNYEYNIMEGILKIPIRTFLSLSGGVKISNLNYAETAVGGNCSLQVAIGKSNSVSLFYESGFLPGINGTLVRNTIGNIQVSKRF